jgi:hypothetical protein
MATLAGLTSGTYRLRDLNDSAAGTVYEGKVIVDKTYGHAAYGCMICCGYTAAFFEFNPLGLAVGDFTDQQVQSGDSCGGGTQTITGDFPTWWTDNTAIATANKNKITGVGVGATQHHAKSVSMYWGLKEYAPSCPETFQQPSGNTNVFDFGILGKNYILVGSDSHVTAANQFQCTNSAHNGAPQPPGGTCSAASSDTSDTITQVPGDNPPSFQFKTLDQSASVGDRTLTFKYDVSGEGGTSAQLNVTARKFAYLANNSPTNTCNLPYGTTRSYVYTVYTHPDGASINPGIAEGAPVTENFNPTLTCQTITGNGSLNANAQIIDNISSGCSNAPLTCTQTSSQTISITGYLVRTNTLQWTSIGVSYTNNGPTQ